jgi:hypothetical protein
MCRFAEYFESPKWRGRLFSWRQFKSWYSWDKGEFSYYEDWGGFNMPGKTFEPFLSGDFNPLTWGERDVLAEIKRLAPTEPFYLIATPKEDEDASCLRHELGHAFYSVDPEYKAAVDVVLASLPADINEKFKRGIKLMGYHDDVLHDELHAYLIDGVGYLTSTTGTWSDFPKSKFFTYWWAGRMLNNLLDEALEKHNVQF